MVEQWRTVRVFVSSTFRDMAAERDQLGKVLGLILREVDRSRPLFIGLLGERYGSVPDSIPEETYAAFPWLEEYPGYSYTSLEIVHGVLRDSNSAKRSLFYFRN